MYTAHRVLQEKIANQLLARAAAEGYDPQQIAESVARRLNDQLNAKYGKLVEFGKRVKQSDLREHKVAKLGGGLELRRMFDIPQIAYDYWGIRLGYECWSDKQFVAEFLRDNPWCAVREVRDTVVTAGVSFDRSGAVTAA